MSLIIKLDEMMSKREINCGDLAKIVEIPAPDLSLLKSGKARAIKFTTLDKLCKALECTPADILEYKNED